MLCYFIPILFAIVGGVLSSEKPYYDIADAEQLFENFIEKYDRHYKDNEEYNKRFQTFKKKLSLINHWNQIHEATFDINIFADEEKPRGGHVPSKTRKLNFRFPDKEWIKQAPKSLDYRNLGLVTEVKNQEHCNSCYVFGVVGNIEGQYAKLTGELISLSEQQVLDCAGKPCSSGGDPVDVMRKLSQQDGLMSEADYPYKNKQGPCRTYKDKVIVNVTSGETYDIPNEEMLKGALAKLGPLAVALYIAPSLGQYSKGEVFKPLDCDGEPDHVVLLVGYSTDEKGTPYWIMKNSWGSDWGEDGYLHLEMGKNHCSILKYGANNAKVALPY